jgi:hypothetical protein
LRGRRTGEEAKQWYKLRKQAAGLANAGLKGRGRRRADAQVGLAVPAHDLVALDGPRWQRGEAAAVATLASPGC